MKVDEAMVDRAARALCAAGGGTLEDCDGRNLHFADARAALVAALEGAELEKTETDLASLRHAARLVVDAEYRRERWGSDTEATFDRAIQALRESLK